MDLCDLGIEGTVSLVQTLLASLFEIGPAIAHANMPVSVADSRSTPSSMIQSFITCLPFVAPKRADALSIGPATDGPPGPVVATHPQMKAGDL
jgi:hypothetical protein